MNSALPTVLVYGVDHFVAEKLVKEILAKDMNVLGVGSWVSGLGDLPNFKYVTDVSEVTGEFSYVFDFTGSELVWKKAADIGAKITVICCNDRERMDLIKERLKGLEANWRVVEAYGVYGPGMRMAGFLAEAIVRAVKNRNLVLPPISASFRLLAADDLVEAIMRATFLSGTEREKYLVVGGETNSREVAEVLINEAKMTRFKVKEEVMELDFWDEREVVENWEKLRWKPKIGFDRGVEEALQYFFSKADEENRKGVAGEDVEVKTGWRKLEVVVEDERESEGQGVTKNEEEKEKVGSQKEEVAKKMAKKKRRKKKKKSVIKNLNVRQGATRRVVVEEEALVEMEPVREVIADLKEKESLSTDKSGRKGLRRWWGLVAGVTVLVLLIFPLNWLRNGWVIYGNAKRMINMVEEKGYEKAEEVAERSIVKIKKVDSQISDWGLNRWRIFRNYQSLLRVGEGVFELGIKTVGLADGLEKMSGAVLGEGEIEWERDLPVLREDLRSLSGNMGVLQARLKGDWGWLPPRWRSWPQRGVSELGKLRGTVDLAVAGMEVLPEFLGTDGKRREYLVLLQNETELRPGGGFIGSFGILSFEDGGLLNFEVKDVYEADGQLKGHVEPPAEIKDYLGEAGWFLRDANWDADFSLAAEKIEWFLQKELGREVDGVIGVNLAVAKAILGGVGEVYVADFGEKINEDNLYEQAEFWSEAKFFPGSNQKASFLGGLSAQLFEELKSLSVRQRLTLFDKMIEMLEKNEIQVALNDNEAAKIMTDLGWAGSMWEGKCGIDRCMADYLYIVEANVGVNKANYFLYRNVEQLVDISERSVARVLKINYENTSKNNNWPGGDYKNYMRVYLPLDVNLAQVALVDGNNNAAKKIYTREEMKIRQVGDKREIGFLMTVPVGEKRVVEIRYSTEINLAGSDKFSYLHYVQKQSGFGDTGLVTLISIPDGWQPLQVEPAASMVGGKLLFNQKLDRDIKMGVELSK